MTLVNGDAHLSKRQHVRLPSLKSDDLDEVDALYDAVDPAYALVYRGAASTGGQSSMRIVTCVKAVVEDRFSKKIFGKLEEFVAAVTYLVDPRGVEHTKALDIPSCCVFDEPPTAKTARSVIQENRTLIRHFAPVLDVDAGMKLLYENQLFKIRRAPRSAGHNEGRTARREMSRNRIPPSLENGHMESGTDQAVLKEDLRNTRNLGNVYRPPWPEPEPKFDDRKGVRNCPSPFEVAADDPGRLIHDPNPPGVPATLQPRSPASDDSRDSCHERGYLFSPKNSEASWEGNLGQEQATNTAGLEDEPGYDSLRHQHHPRNFASRGSAGNQKNGYSQAHERSLQQKGHAAYTDGFDGYAYEGNAQNECGKDAIWENTWMAGNNQKGGVQYCDKLQEPAVCKHFQDQSRGKNETIGEQLRYQGESLDGYVPTQKKNGFEEDTLECRANVGSPLACPTHGKVNDSHMKVFEDVNIAPGLKSIQRLGSGDRNANPIDGREALATPAGRNGAHSQFSMEVDPWDTVGSLKQKIWKTRGYAPSIQRLVFNGKVLPDKMSLADCDVTEDSTLTLWLLMGKGRAVRIG